MEMKSGSKQVSAAYPGLKRNSGCKQGPCHISLAGNRLCHPALQARGTHWPNLALFRWPSTAEP
eukprot:11144253-Karenia_brevis.AAC.1